MNFTDTFINKPVLAIVVSLLILVLGLRALSDISVRLTHFAVLMLRQSAPTDLSRSSELPWHMGEDAAKPKQV